MDPNFPLMSPRTRRLHRGRSNTVLSNMMSSNMTNISTSSSSADSSYDHDVGPSPDELVITARGRRSLPLTFSPDVHSTPPRGSGNARGLSKLARSAGVARLLLPKRTSPRKRLTLSDSPPAASNSLISGIIPIRPLSDQEQNQQQQKLKKSPNSKKSKMEEFAVATLEPDHGYEQLSTPTILKGLSRHQLEDVIAGILSKQPDLEEEIRQDLPKPDLVPMEERLNNLKRNIFRALPNNRLESKTDAMAYSRVAIHLLAFKKEVTDQGKRLTEANAWPSLVDHAIMAWNFVLATPTWDNAPHNNVKRQCFKLLASNLIYALKKGTWSTDTCISIRNK